MMLIGNLYRFNNIDQEALKHFNIIELSLEGLSNSEIKRNIEEYLYLNNDKNIVINSNTIYKSISVYLRKLELNGYKILAIDEFLEKKLKKLYLSENHIVKLKPFTKWQYLQKRAIDLIISIPLFIIALPIMLYSAYRIKKESPDAGIFFVQPRVGKDEKVFNCYKFRSMRTDVNYFSKYTQENDPRVFPWGNFMRKSRIDELPQLWNVIKGDMHVIGPRAEWVELVKEYEENLPNYHTRHIIAPGITGWAQVNYPYGANLEDTRQKLMYDLYYIKHWNIWLEIKTIFKTIMVVLGKKGL